MKLIKFEHNGERPIGVMSGERIVPISSLGLGYHCMNELIAGATKAELDTMRKAALSPPGETIPYNAVKKLSPIPRPRQDVICIGYNYSEHVAESSKFKGLAADIPEHAIYFSKRVNEALPDGGEITAREIDEHLDYEAELAVIIGRDAYKVSAADVGEYIFGYTILNDISARTLQTRHKQYYFGKSLDSCTPMGPWIVTADEISFPPRLAIASYVNGELRQNSNTERMIFTIPHIIEELSSGITLKAGTIIATGTPSGVGMGFSPPRFLKSGDNVECVIEGIGKLCNTVR